MQTPTDEDEYERLWIKFEGKPPEKRVEYTGKLMTIEELSKSMANFYIQQIRLASGKGKR